MRETMPGASSEKVGKGALNRAENPSQPLVEDDQFILGSSEEKCRIGASRMAALAREAQRSNGFSGSTVGSIAGKDAVAAHRAFDEADPPAAFLLLAALLLLDKDRTWLRGVARMVGCDIVDRPKLTDAEFRRLVEAHAKRSKTGAAALEEALEDAP